jgi:carboxylesterase
MEGNHAEYSHRSETKNTVLVFVHGIHGSPRQFDELIEALGGRYSIENLLLPGHGMTTREFHGAHAAQWQNCVDERVGRLQKEFENIVLIGHSMGSLLAVQKAICRPRHIRGLFLMAMPLAVHISFPYIRNGLETAFSKKDRNETIAAGRRVHSVAASNPFAYLTGTPQYIELWKLWRATRERIRELKLPVIVVRSEKDEIVSRASLRYLKMRENIRVITAEHAGHYYYPPEDREKIARALRDFIRLVCGDDGRRIEG